MTKIRVLVVDDSGVVRRLVCGVVSGDPALEVVGTAPNGKIALQKIAETHPDVITLDVDMPEMDGLATLTEIRKQHPSLPVIMLSSLTERGAATTLECLYRGASDYVTKPIHTQDVEEAAKVLSEALLPRIKVFSLRRVDGGPAARWIVPARHAGIPAHPQQVGVVVIGASTGGPNALPELLAPFPEDFPIPILIAQHMPPLFTRTLAERLDGLLALRVKEAESGEKVRGGDVRLAPGDFHLELQRQELDLGLILHQGPQENSCRPSVDVLFRSAASCAGAGALGVVLTGMGRDGLRGASEIRAAGGRILAQDEASSVVWGMPGAVAAAGLADTLLPPRELGLEIVRRVRESRGAPAGSGGR